jgi:creatinine amidohydrolase
MTIPKFLMAEMTSPELREVVKEGRVAVMPAGIIEQHGPALPLDTDIRLAYEITVRAAAQVPELVVVVPPIVHGHSPHHMDFPGTLTVDPLHMVNYVLDVCLSLAHHGFTKILIVNGHGSNVPVLDLVARQTIIRTEGRTSCGSIFYMNSAEYNRAVNEVFPELGSQAGHADAIETSLYMAVAPGTVQLSKAKDDPANRINALGTAPFALRLWWSSYSAEGIYGTVTGSSQEKGEILVTGAVKGLVGIFKEYHAKKIPARVDHH